MALVGFEIEELETNKFPHCEVEVNEDYLDVRIVYLEAHSILVVLGYTRKRQSKKLTGLVAMKTRRDRAEIMVQDDKRWWRQKYRASGAYIYVKCQSPEKDPIGATLVFRK